MPRTNRIERKRRRANRVQELQRRIDDLETEVAWLARVVEEVGEREDARATGPCRNCSRGVLVHRNGELRCSNCGYGRFL